MSKLHYNENKEKGKFIKGNENEKLSTKFRTTRQQE